MNITPDTAATPARGRRITIEHEGDEYDPESERWEDYPADWRLTVLSEGRYFRDGRELTEPSLLRYIRDTYDPAEFDPVAVAAAPPDPWAPRTRSDGPRRFLIPGLWAWGTKPMLGGPPKAGKTALSVDLAAALTVRGYRFLDHFDPAELTESERARGVYLINAETPPEDFEQALAAAGVELGSGRVAVDHLEDLGGPRVFDLTDPAVYDSWVDRLSAWCLDCPEVTRDTPLVLIVDGLTAILGGTTDRYGTFYERLKDLCRELGIPNCLLIAHNTLAGDHLMGGVEAQAGADGLWNLTATRGGQRRFSVTPRLGGVQIRPTAVDLDERGRLVMRRRAEHEQAPDAARGRRDAEPPARPLTEQMRDLVAAREATGQETIGSDLVDGLRASKEAIKAARDELVGSGLLLQEPLGRRGGGFRYRTAPRP